MVPDVVQLSGFVPNNLPEIRKGKLVFLSYLIDRRPVAFRAIHYLPVLLVQVVPILSRIPLGQQSPNINTGDHAVIKRNDISHNGLELAQFTINILDKLVDRGYRLLEDVDVLLGSLVQPEQVYAGLLGYRGAHQVLDLIVFQFVYQRHATLDALPHTFLLHLLPTRDQHTHTDPHKFVELGLHMPVLEPNPPLHLHLIEEVLQVVQGRLLDVCSDEQAYFLRRPVLLSHLLETLSELI